MLWEMDVVEPLTKGDSIIMKTQLHKRLSQDFVQEILNFNSHRTSYKRGEGLRATWGGASHALSASTAMVGMAWWEIELSLFMGDRTVVFISCRRKNRHGFIRSWIISKVRPKCSEEDLILPSWLRRWPSTLIIPFIGLRFPVSL